MLEGESNSAPYCSADYCAGYWLVSISKLCPVCPEKPSSIQVPSLGLKQNCMAGAWQQEREKVSGSMLQDGEQVQPLRPDAVWPQHQPGISDTATGPDPGAHANSAFAPPQPPYADGNAMALLQQWWAYYAQQRPLQPGHQPHNGAVPTAFGSMAAGDHSNLHSMSRTLYFGV